MILGDGVGFCRAVRFGVTLIFTLVLVLALRIIKTIFIHRLRRRGLGAFGRRVRLPACISDSLTGRLDHAGRGTTGQRVGRVLSRIGGGGVSRVHMISTGKVIHNADGTDGRSIIKRQAASRTIGGALLGGHSRARGVCSGSDRGHCCIGIVPLINTTAGGIINTICLQTGLRDICSDIGNVSLVCLSTTLIAIILKLKLTVLVSHRVAQPVRRVHGRTLEVTQNSCSNRIGIVKGSRLNRLTKTIGGLSIHMRRTRRSASSRQQHLSDILSRVDSKILTAGQHNGIAVVGGVTLRVLSVSSRSSILNGSVLSILNIQHSCAIHRLVSGSRRRALFSLGISNGSVVLDTCFSPVRHRSNFISNLMYILRSIADRRGRRHRHGRFISGISRRLQAPLADIGDCIRTLDSNT